nr:CoB--CoM heterodisulfide reductase iron-sulfur subunit A family protein [Anaerolineales bacterium]
YCPNPIEKIPNEFNCGLDFRTPIHIPFPQAVPNKPLIDRENCIRFRTGGCGACENICPAGAINYDMTDEFVEEEVGAIIAATGYEILDPSIYEEYGYGRYPDVVTSLEFERMVSASGPFNGELTRPSNGKPPKTIVFLQCIGSRRETNGKPYCSKICCMYTAKHAILYKHKVHDGQAFVFYMDVRAGGKNYDQFVRRVVKEDMATYLRGRVSKVYASGDKLIVRGADTLSGKQIEIAAEMVVLAPALIPSSGVRELSQKLRVGYDEHGFLLEAHPKLRPVETNTAGVFLAGACHSPKDIPESVAQAGAAAGKALGLISHNRLSREPTIGIVDESSCNGCFECEGVCAYGAIGPKELTDKKGNTIATIASINEGLCQGCGACAATCRSKSIEVQGYRDDQLFAAINAINR